MLWGCPFTARSNRSDTRFQSPTRERSADSCYIEHDQLRSQQRPTAMLWAMRLYVFRGHVTPLNAPELSASSSLALRARHTASWHNIPTQLQHHQKSH